HNLNHIKFNYYLNRGRIDNYEVFRLGEDKDIITLNTDGSIEIISGDDFTGGASDEDEYIENVNQQFKKYISLCIEKFLNDPGFVKTDDMLGIYPAILELVKEKIEENGIELDYEVELDNELFVFPVIQMGTKYNLEYRYNPEDKLLGGELKIRDYNFRNIYASNDDEIRDDAEISYVELLVYRDTYPEAQKEIDDLLKKLGYDLEKLKVIREVSAQVDPDEIDFKITEDTRDKILRELQETYSQEQEQNLLEKIMEWAF
ncbi:MAG: hypothetical protein ACOC2J_04970, partial [bacterium]